MTRPIDEGLFVDGVWMATYTGIAFHPLDPRVYEVRIADIAHALSNTCRYNGHCSKFYSVAEHSVHVSYMVSPEHALEALLHDASEAYVGDVIRPLKGRLQDFLKIEQLNDKAIRDRFGLPAVESPEVKLADTRILRSEMKALFPFLTGIEWPYQIDPMVRVECWQPARAKERFFERYHELSDAKEGGL